MDYLLFLQELRDAAPDALNLFFYGLSEFMGSLAPVLIGVIIFWCIDKKGGYLVMSCYLACNAINQIVKNIACVYRPWILDSRIHPYEAAISGATGYSFPSGHTAMATGFFGGFALWFSKKKWVVALCVALVLLTGFSRNWMGCHTPQDVICSLALALVTMLTTSWVLRKVDEKPHYDLVASAVFLAASIVFTAFCALKSYPLDYDALGNLLVDPHLMIVDCYRSFGALFGISIAWPLERHLVRFSVDGSIKIRIIRGLVGVACLAATMGLCKYALPLAIGSDPAKFIEYASIVLVGVAGYPALFTWFERRHALA